MKQQNYKNHPQLVPGYHFVTLLLVLALLIGSVVNLLNTSKDNLYSASLICLVAVVIGLVAFYARSFALKAQDRAIRAEENFRHFLLTNKPLDTRLTLSQIIALRFASDEEMPVLALKAAEQGMSSKAIKQSVKRWRADHNRV